MKRSAVIVRQPNGLFAVFSTRNRDFTQLSLTGADLLALSSAFGFDEEFLSRQVRDAARDVPIGPWWRRLFMRGRDRRWSQLIALMRRHHGDGAADGTEMIARAEVV
jgi:hypothetical protein